MSPRKKEEPRSFEENMARLEEIVSLLERGDAKLADSLALFEEGTRLAALCGGLLDEAEQKVVKLQKGPDGEPVELPFDTEE
ncbi:MAG: exodeoxyribonuclease VII small subunit [Oscillibacter sp.]|nr:exodeoxyribonuclease VII small subunit [Oscillibacter sp.]